MTHDAPFAILLVPSTSHAVRLEKLLGERRIPCKMIPVPRHISSDCGVCVRILYSDSVAAQHVAEEAGMVLEGIVSLQGGAA